jgi:hypothetical protein
MRPCRARRLRTRSRSHWDRTGYVAFDWIESHKGLREHPKTVRLAAEWRDRKTCVIGHLHELWWWVLEYAPDGVLRASVLHLVPVACEWHGAAERFWSGLLAAGFVDVEGDGYAVHDWPQYAGRRIDRWVQEAERKAAWHAKARRRNGATPDAPAHNSGATTPAPDSAPGASGAGQPARPDAKNRRSPTRAGHQPDHTTPDSRSVLLPDLTNSLPSQTGLTGPVSTTTRPCARGDPNLPDEVRRRLAEPPIRATTARSDS